MFVFSLNSSSCGTDGKWLWFTSMRALWPSHVCHRSALLRFIFSEAHSSSSTLVDIEQAISLVMQKQQYTM